MLLGRGFLRRRSSAGALLRLRFRFFPVLFLLGRPRGFPPLRRRSPPVARGGRFLLRLAERLDLIEALLERFD